MAATQFSLSWEAYKNNICNGLSSLQQNGEFVDMTLAADGHHVKVHQVIVALASPYIKELITSANCPHPIIFLNKISYKTLSSILEYVYTGEVMVSVEHLQELVQAGRELHIKGLEDMKVSPAENMSLVQSRAQTQPKMEETVIERLDNDICLFEVTEEQSQGYSHDNNMLGEITRIRVATDMEESYHTETYDEEMHEEEREQSREVAGDEEEGVRTDAHEDGGTSPEISTGDHKRIQDKGVKPNVMQYTTSNQGSLQMILNRFVYYLKHSNRDGTRQWRCVDYVNALRCPAHVVTKYEVVTQRIAAHTHAFHDRRILKKVKAGAVFATFTDALAQGDAVRGKKTPTQHRNQQNIS